MSRLVLSAAFAALGAGVIAAASQLPDEPAKQFGSSITGSFEGWFDNPDGSHNLLIGYLNRNRSREVDVPIGPNNHIDPAGPDHGQPTHFLPGRQTGVFTIVVPKDFAPTQRLTWTVTINGESNTVPFTLNSNWALSPLKDEAVGNTPPVVHLFTQGAPPLQGPLATLPKAIAKTTSVAKPLDLPLWAEDDAKYTSGTNAPLTGNRPPVRVSWSKYRGPGTVTFDKARPDMKALKGGKVNEPYAGETTATAKFSEPGEYVLHAYINDYSGFGEYCCWTTALVKVTVTP
jgi:hypothetical protein